MSTDITEVVKSLGVTLTLREGDMVTDVVVVSKIVEADGRTRVAIGWSEGMSFVTRLGLVTAAAQMESVAAVPGPRGDDDD